MHPKDAPGIANSVDHDLGAMIWVCTVCPDLSVRKLWNITVRENGCASCFCIECKGINQFSTDVDLLETPTFRTQLLHSIAGACRGIS